MRPKKERRIECSLNDRCFLPRCKNPSKIEVVTLSLDELEAIRLAYLEGMKQDEVAEKMEIHRSTVSRTLSSANYKIADALVSIKAIKVEGAGCCCIINAKDENK